jgi:uncharacterized membrane protein
LASREEKRRRLLARQHNLPANANRQIAVIQGTAYSGPLPPPQQLAEFEQIVPGSAQAIFDEFQAQGPHRRRIERWVVISDIVRAQLGQFCGVGIAGYIVWTGGEILKAGNSLVGFGAIGSAVAIAAGPFLVRNYLQSQERRRQQDALPPKKR